jgi:two-component SAPR family response regulator
MDGGMTQGKLRALVVEDDFLLCEALADSLLAMNYDVVSRVGTLSDGIKAVEASAVDLAVVDINLRGLEAFPLLDELSARRIPFVLATSSSRQDIPHRFAAYPLVNKPYSRSQLNRAIDSFSFE